MARASILGGTRRSGLSKIEAIKVVQTASAAMIIMTRVILRAEVAENLNKPEGRVF